MSAGIQQRGEPWLLLGEITHRVRNEYAAAISWLELAAARANSPEAKVTLEMTAERLHKYASVHGALRIPAGNSTELSSYLRNLCYTMSQSRLKHQGIHLTLAEEPIILSAEQCWCIALIVYELVTNAARHAFAHSGSGGHIGVEITNDADGLVCRVTDDGVWRAGCVGNGTRITDSLAARIGASMARSSGACGTTVTLVLPRAAIVLT